MTHKAQIIAGRDSKVPELPKGLEAEHERGKSDRYFCNPGEMG